jgi:hypothetical protein
LRRIYQRAAPQAVIVPLREFLARRLRWVGSLRLHFQRLVCALHFSSFVARSCHFYLRKKTMNRHHGFTFEDAGASSKKRVSYIVGTAPKLTVFRSFD